MRIYLVRHPKPDIASGICYGRTDVVVSRQEQSLVLPDLISALPKGAPVFSSPSSRCTGLADNLAGALDCAAPIHDPRLAELDFGAWEMCAWNDIPVAEIDAWAADMVGYRPGGGENVAQMAQRVRAFQDDLLQLDRDCAIVICHAGTIRLLLACQPALSIADMALYAARVPHKIAYGKMTVMDC